MEGSVESQDLQVGSAAIRKRSKNRVADTTPGARYSSSGWALGESFALRTARGDPIMLHHRREHPAAGVDEEREQISSRRLQRFEHRKCDLDGDDRGSNSARVSGRVLHGGSCRFWFGDHRPLGGERMDRHFFTSSNQQAPGHPQEIPGRVAEKACWFTC